MLASGTQSFKNSRIKSDRLALRAELPGPYTNSRDSGHVGSIRLRYGRIVGYLESWAGINGGAKIDHETPYKGRFVAV